MAYKYPASAWELKVVETLKRRGWQIHEPSCPECHGHGVVKPKDWWNIEKYPVQNEWPRCPQGCPIPSYFF